MDNATEQQQEEQQQEAPELSLREQIEAARDEVNERQAEPEEGAEGETTEQRATRARERNGRFAKGSEQAAQAPAPAPAPTATPAAPNGEQQQEAVAAPPQSWRAEARAHWDKLPSDLREYLSHREQEMERGLAKFDQDKNMGKAMREAIQPFAANLQKSGVAPHQAVATLMNFENTLRNGDPAAKMNAMHLLARTYGINLQATLQHQPNLPHPAIAQMQGEIHRLRESEAQRQQQFEQHQLAQAQAEVENFRANAPHLEAVRPQMARLLDGGLAGTLQEAYDMAVYANPTLRQSLIAGQPSQSRPSPDAQRRTADAKRAGSSIAGNPGSSKPSGSAPADRSLREELRANLRAATSGRI